VRATGPLDAYSDKVYRRISERIVGDSENGRGDASEDARQQSLYLTVRFASVSGNGEYASHTGARSGWQHFCDACIAFIG